MEIKGNIKLNIIEVYEHDDDKILNLPPLFRLHVEFTDVYFDKLENLPELKLNYKIKK